jgi:hypothetical protein
MDLDTAAGELMFWKGLSEDDAWAIVRQAEKDFRGDKHEI